MDAKDGRQGRQEGATATKISYVFSQEKYIFIRGKSGNFENC